MLLSRKLLKHAIGEVRAAIVIAFNMAYQADVRELSRIADRKTPQKQAVQNRENGSVRADPQPDREYGCEAKDRGLAKHTQAKKKVAVPALNKRNELLIPYRLH